MTCAAKVLDIDTPPGRTKSLDDLKVDEALGYKIHPYADAFPMMKGKLLDALVEDIRSNGLREPIEYIEHNGEKIIVDGRNRLLACITANVEPLFSKCFAAADDDHLLGYIWSRNVHRRDLTASQRAIIATKQRKFIDAISKAKEEAKRANLKRGTKTPTKSRKGTSAPSGSTAKIVAKEANVSERTMKDAMVVDESGDQELVEEVETGKKSVKEAAKETRMKRTAKKSTTKAATKKAPTKTRKTPRRRRDPNSPEAVAGKLIAKHDREWCLELVAAINDRLSEES